MLFVLLISYRLLLFLCSGLHAWVCSSSYPCLLAYERFFESKTPGTKNSYQLSVRIHLRCKAMWFWLWEIFSSQREDIYPVPTHANTHKQTNKPIHLPHLFSRSLPWLMIVHFPYYTPAFPPVGCWIQVRLPTSWAHHNKSNYYSMYIAKKKDHNLF